MGKIITQTPRLIIREFEIADTQAVFAFNSDPSVTRYTGDAGMVKTPEDAANVIENIWLAEYAKYGYGRWALVLKETEEVIGFCGFKYETRIMATDIGYRLLPRHWGRGYATEAMRACLQYARTHMALDQVVGDAVVENTASINVLLKLGLEYQAQYQEDGVTLNRYHMRLKA
ncbi:GNAT family N-acetyltransferase [Shewanella sp. AS16]|uniref:GNAT family N-acetyltransferase n=1 Tax=Shewanella sp. AS16 TaxID=2907625 RepID=UPI001F2D4816|nr:GNAT family N-acetyltransferase [Shewanella sp. AS16]MCE9686917.1 GNAT family N-acetyltransferase [Shewanella sp. AS16]